MASAQQQADAVMREPPPAVSAEVRRYCAAIAATAGAARNARQEKTLHELEQKIAERLAELETKRVELQAMIDRHDALLKKVDDQLVTIYARMRPDVASAQLGSMEEEMAAALLMRLQPKQSSAILNEMEATRAVVLTKKFADLSTLVGGGKRR
jgi:flagellar motility protein MotE (MotC chaperone)